MTPAKFYESLPPEDQASVRDAMAQHKLTLREALRVMAEGLKPQTIKKARPRSVVRQRPLPPFTPQIRLGKEFEPQVRAKSGAIIEYEPWEQ